MIEPVVSRSVVCRHICTYMIKPSVSINHATNEVDVDLHVALGVDIKSDFWHEAPIKKTKKFQLIPIDGAKNVLFTRLSSGIRILNTGLVGVALGARNLSSMYDLSLTAGHINQEALSAFRGGGGSAQQQSTMNLL